VVGQCSGGAVDCSALGGAAARGSGLQALLIKARPRNSVRGLKKKLGGKELGTVGCLFVRRASDMPKLKTRRAAAKRFRLTGSGKFMRRHAFRSHLLDHKSSKRKRFLGTMAVVDDTDHDRVQGMLPYAG
jgi:large subunit ribosomal protein L35